MVLMKCAVGPGLRNDQVSAEFADETGFKDWQLVEKNFLSELDGQYFLPVSVVRHDVSNNRVLIELTHESVRGTYRYWIPADAITEMTEIAA